MDASVLDGAQVNTDLRRFHFPIVHNVEPDVISSSQTSMVPETYLFFLSLIIYGAIILLLIYYVLTLADLESDYLNAQQCCDRLNAWVTAKLLVHAVILLMMLCGMHWLLASLNAPMVFWLAFEIYRLPSDSLGVYDPLEIHGRGMNRLYLRNCMIYLSYYFTMFFIMLYYLISAFTKGDHIRKHDDGHFVVEPFED